MTFGEGNRYPRAPRSQALRIYPWVLARPALGIPRERDSRSIRCRGGSCGAPAVERPLLDASAGEFREVGGSPRPRMPFTPVGWWPGVTGCEDEPGSSRATLYVPRSARQPTLTGRRAPDPPRARSSTAPSCCHPPFHLHARPEREGRERTRGEAPRGARRAAAQRTRRAEQREVAISSRARRAVARA